MARISQEFYCGECKGYFLVRLNMALNFEAEIVCPNCGHKHRRCVKDGQIYEGGRFNTDSKEEIMPTKASYSKTPLTEKMQKAHEKNDFNGRRDGVVVCDRPPMYDRWLEIAARERGETE